MSTPSSSECSALPEPTARDLLRDRTRPRHEEVDRRFARFDLARREGYRAFLHAHALAFLPLEAGLDRFGAERLLPDWTERRRGPALGRDLADVGAEPAVAPPAAIACDAEAWGLLYVLEGSRFGGRMIARALAHGTPARYIGAGHARGAWADLVARMEQGLQRNDDREAAIAMAGRAFDLFASAADAAAVGALA